MKQQSATQTRRRSALAQVAAAPWGVFFDSCGLRDPDLGRWRWLAGVGSPDGLQSMPVHVANVPSSRWRLALLSYPDGDPTLVDPPIQLGELAQVWGETWQGEPFTHEAPAGEELDPSWHFTPQGEVSSSLSRAAYLAAAQALIEHIRAGDVYEVNLTVGFRVKGTLQNPAALFAALCQQTPAGMAAYVKHGQRHVLSISPERFAQLAGRRLATQPIKGTLPRARTWLGDLWQAHRLSTHERFRAENVMIVDLARNDLNRVCVPGSVRVPRLFEVQRFRRLHHLVSTITGELSPHETSEKALRALFPPGSMTGAPKRAARSLIARYEPTPRGLYSGAIGYLAPTGDFDFSVVIRTLEYDGAAGELRWQVGGAITADSDPQAEWDEALLKGQALRDTLLGPS